ncbi:MAG: hypothetical protein ACLGJC_17420 [Alphaproteobacteria bacterium]
MPQPDLLERARSAVTQDEECSVLRAAVCHFVGDAMQAMPLIDIIVAVRSGRAPRPVLLGVVAAQRGVLDAEGITDEKARTILLATFNRMWEDSERDQPDEWFLFDIDFQEILDGAAAGARRVRTWIVPADSRGSWWLTAKGRDLFDTILYASLKAWHAEPGQRTRHG